MTLPHKGESGKKSRAKPDPVSGSSRKVKTTGKPPGQKRYLAESRQRALQEPEISYNTRIRPIGNSRGVILNSEAMASAGLNPEADITIQVRKGVITILQEPERPVNTDLATWGKQFVAAKRTGITPEKDLFDGMRNDFDSKEW